MDESPTSPWVWVGRSRTRARITAAARHPLIWLGRRVSPSRGLSEVHTIPVSCDEVLARLMELPVSTWTYGWDHDSVKHLGPMAQDFARAFGLGDSDRRIDMIDAAGVLMASLQAMHKRVVALEARLADGEPEQDL